MRAGSVFGSHWSFVTRVSVLPIVYWSILYGPVDSGCWAYLAGSLTAGSVGIGPIAGNDA